MLNVELDRQAGLAILRPTGALSERDFETVCNVIDPYLEDHGQLTGLMIHTKDFPGWESFGAMLKHFKFVKDHQRKIARVALVTDSKIGDLVELIGGHFISAKVKHFPQDAFIDARKWVLDPKPAEGKKS